MQRWLESDAMLEAIIAEVERLCPRERTSRFKPCVLDGPWSDCYLQRPLSAQSRWTKPSRESRL